MLENGMVLGAERVWEEINAVDTRLDDLSDWDVCCWMEESEHADRAIVCAIGYDPDEMHDEGLISTLMAALPMDKRVEIYREYIISNSLEDMVWNDLTGGYNE